MISARRLSSGRYFLTALAGVLKVRPATFRGWVATGVSGVTTPMMATLTPWRFFMTKGLRAGKPLTLAPSTGNRAWAILCFKTLGPKSNSWLPTTMASNRMAFITSMAGFAPKKIGPGVSLDHIPGGQQ